MFAKSFPEYFLLIGILHANTVILVHYDHSLVRSFAGEPDGGYPLSGAERVVDEVAVDLVDERVGIQFKIVELAGNYNGRGNPGYMKGLNIVPDIVPLGGARIPISS